MNRDVVYLHQIFHALLGKAGMQQATLLKFSIFMNGEDRQIVAEMLQEARDGGIHDTLVFLEDEMNLNALRIVIDGIELPLDPFWDLYHDWQYRRSGESWPDEK